MPVDIGAMLSLHARSDMIAIPAQLELNFELINEKEFLCELAYPKK